jgi:hypothetical protein
MAIRLDETALGAAAGITVALTIFPRRTTNAFRDAGLDFLQTSETQERAVEVRRAVHQLRASAGPLARGWVAATPTAIRVTIHAAMSSSYWLRELALNPAERDERSLDQLRCELSIVLQTLRDQHDLPSPHSRPEAEIIAELSHSVWRFARALDAATRR